MQFFFNLIDNLLFFFNMEINRFDMTCYIECSYYKNFTNHNVLTILKSYIYMCVCVYSIGIPNIWVMLLESISNCFKM